MSPSKNGGETGAPRFKPGNPSGPGRPEGSRDKATILLDKLADDAGSDVVDDSAAVPAPEKSPDGTERAAIISTAEECVFCGRHLFASRTRATPPARTALWCIAEPRMQAQPCVVFWAAAFPCWANVRWDGATGAGAGAGAGAELTAYQPRARMQAVTMPSSVTLGQG